MRPATNKQQILTQNSILSLLSPHKQAPDQTDLGRVLDRQVLERRIITAELTQRTTQIPLQRLANRVLQPGQPHLGRLLQGDPLVQAKHLAIHTAHLTDLHVSP